MVAEAGRGLGVMAEAGIGLGLVAEAGIGLGGDFERCWEVSGGVGPTQGSSLPVAPGHVGAHPETPQICPDMGPRLAQSV